MSAAKDFSAILSTASRPERTVDVCLRGDLVVRLQQLEEEMLEARNNRVTLADAGKVKALAEQVEAVRQEMQDATYPFRLRGLGPRAMKQLEVEHPADEKDPEDEGMQWHLATFAPALIRACLVDPVVTDEQWAELVDGGEPKLTYGQVDELFGAAFSLSRGKVTVPFSPAASAILRNSEETSE